MTFKYLYANEKLFVDLLSIDIELHVFVLMFKVFV